MSNYNPDELNEAEENAESPEGKAEITEINETLARDVYGNETEFDYDPDRPMIEVTAESDSDDELTEVFGLPEDDKSWHNPNFKLGQFKDRYGSVPTEGMEVDTAINEDSGFLEIDF